MVVVWMAASKVPSTTHIGAATFKTWLALRSAGLGTLNLQEGTSLTVLHGPRSNLVAEQVVKRGGLGPLRPWTS